MLPGGHQGGHTVAGRLTPSQAAMGPVGAERAAVFWLAPAVPVRGQKGPLEHVGVPLWLGRIQGPRRPWRWSPVGLWGDGEELGAGARKDEGVGGGRRGAQPAHQCARRCGCPAAIQKIYNPRIWKKKAAVGRGGGG